MRKGKRTAFYGLFLALALVAGYVEQLLPVSLGIPGVKLGLANVVTMVLLYTVGVRAAVGITAARILLAGMLFGTGFSIVYSAAGAVCSMLVMLLLKRTGRFSSVSVSMAGGVFHNVGQIIVAALVVENMKMAYYLPFLLVSGVVTGCLIGVVARLCLRYLGRK